MDDTWVDAFNEVYLKHYGMPRRSGRYPWGSGENPRQRMRDFASRVRELRNGGMSDKEIAGALGMVDRRTGEPSTSILRTRYSNALDQIGIDRYESARAMMDDGMRPSEAAKMMGVSESTLRSYLSEKSYARRLQAQNVASFIKEQIDQKGMIDVGIGVERELGISREKMKQVLDILEEDGYPTYGGRIDQVTNPGRKTTMKVVCPPGTEHKEIYDTGKVNDLLDYKVRQDAEGNDIVEKGFVYPKSMDSGRIQIRYAEEGGSERDGLVELRRGVDDISLGESRYAQVRILVDDKSYIKGMAAYSDDLPEGKDIIFNTNKPAGTPIESVLKDIKREPDGTPSENPFGSLIKETGGQSYYIDEKGERQLSLINKRGDEGDWGDWSDSLPSQFLSKQSKTMIERQLNMAADDKKAELNDILALTNPTVKKEMLQTFADDCDAAAVHLQAAALPRQKYQVILPVPSMKDNEVYAPNYHDGETVALIRYPHGGTFEIPILKVNNKHADARKMLGHDPADAIGINSKVAERLSGADFDGDTVMVIPANSDYTQTKIKSTPPLQGLVGFDHRMEYPPREGAQRMRNTQVEMGKISNLITDMTLKGATPDELSRAVKHSMVVIDAEKHGLDYKRSEEANGIPALRKKYMGRVDEETGKFTTGASTLISKASSEQAVIRRQGSPRINQKGKDWYDPSQPEGALIWKTVREEYPVTRKTRAGEVTEMRVRMQKSTKMAEVDDARKLMSYPPTPQEKLYAQYANTMKSLANQARKEMVYAGKINYSASASRAYSEEVSTLMSKLSISLKNAPRERRAQLLANTVIKAKKDANPHLTNKEIRKLAQQALASARRRVGAKREEIVISDREWAAIQAGAISETKLKSIIKNTNIDNLRSLATPRTRTGISSGKLARLKNMNNMGYTPAQIAQALDISPTTVRTYLDGKE